jgi:putative ABC transport system substrate-binding protein
MGAEPERAYTSGSMGQTGSRFGRRSFLKRSVGLAGLALLAGCGMPPLPGQQPAKVPRIGFLSPANGPGSREFEGFRQGLRELDYVEGQSLAIEYRLADGRPERLPFLAAELVGLAVDVVVTDGGAAATAARGATSTIPVVMGVGPPDPVQAGLAASVAHPGGNVTGFTLTAPGLYGKRLQLFKEAVPGLSRVAALWDPASPATGLTETQAAARSLGLELQILEIRTPDDLESAFETARSEHADGLFSVSGPLLANARGQIADLAAKHRLPGMFPDRDFAAAGGLMAYGPDPANSFRRAATYVDKILKGAKPADLPVEQPTKFDFVVNLRSARALRLTIPQSVLMQATEVIQ